MWLVTQCCTVCRSCMCSKCLSVCVCVCARCSRLPVLHQPATVSIATILKARPLNKASFPLLSCLWPGVGGSGVVRSLRGVVCFVCTCVRVRCGVISPITANLINLLTSQGQDLFNRCLITKREKRRVCVCVCVTFSTMEAPVCRERQKKNDRTCTHTHSHTHIWVISLFWGGIISRLTCLWICFTIFKLQKRKQEVHCRWDEHPVLWITVRKSFLCVLFPVCSTLNTLS